ncbi:MAG: cell division protein FtsQ/DivIB [Syntrophotaleaceae bacterium]
MRDIKNSRAPRVKGKANRFKKQRTPWAWRRFFGKLLRVSVYLVSIALLTCGGVLTARMLVASDFFAVARVRVENQQRLSQEEILALSDIQVGANIFDLDLDMIGRKIEENPWVATACVERIFPDEVMIRVSERRPAAIVSLGYLYYVDETGEIFKVLDAKDSLDYPLISGMDRQRLLEKPEESRNELRAAVELLAQLDRRNIFQLDEVSELSLDAREGMTLYTYHGGVPVRLGTSGFGDKLDRLEAVYRELQPRLAAIDYIDLKVAERVIVKLDDKFSRGKG